jgi:hypothetical protein
MVANLALSPLAFWMSASMPAAANASVRNGRSAVSQRADDAASGRITPTLPPAPGADAASEAVGAQLLAELLLLEELPHAVTSSDATARPATAPMSLRDIKVFPFIVWINP